MRCFANYFQVPCVVNYLTGHILEKHAALYELTQLTLPANKNEALRLKELCA